MEKGVGHLLLTKHFLSKFAANKHKMITFVTELRMADTVVSLE